MNKSTKIIVIVLLVIAIAGMIIWKNRGDKNVIKENNDKLSSSIREEQVASRPKTPLDDLLTNGLPTVLDLGSDSCIPCKMMKPIFAELEEELAEKVNILILDVSEYSNLADKYQVRVIPTQIFFDADGKQYWRHEGFLAKEDIIKKLKETGAEL